MGRIPKARGLGAQPARTVPIHRAVALATKAPQRTISSTPFSIARATADQHSWSNSLGLELTVAMTRRLGLIGLVVLAALAVSSNSSAESTQQRSAAAPALTDALSDTFGSVARVTVTTEGSEIGCAPGFTICWPDFGSPTISADGRFIAFSSLNSSLFGPGGGIGIFVHDLATGTTSLAAADAINSNWATSLSGDGAFLVYSSVTADGLATGSGDTQINLHSRSTGETAIISAPVSTGSLGFAVAPAISADGGTVAYLARSVSTYPWSSTPYFYDTRTGSTQAAPLPPVPPEAASFTSAVSTPALSSDGRLVAFDLTMDAGLRTIGSALYVYNRASGGSVRVSGQLLDELGYTYLEHPSLSDDGSLLAFSAGTNQSVGDAFVYRLSDGSIQRLTTDSSTAGITLSGDGSTVVFTKLTSAVAEVLREDLSTSTITTVSTPSSGAASDGSSVLGFRGVSSDGGTIAFASSATNLVAADTNGLLDAFVWRRSAVSATCHDLSVTVQQDTPTTFAAPCSPTVSEARTAGLTTYSITVGGLNHTLGLVDVGYYSDQITYTPPPAFSGDDTFLLGLLVCQGTSCSSSPFATVTLHVQPRSIIGHVVATGTKCQSPMIRASVIDWTRGAEDGTADKFALRVLVQHQAAPDGSFALSIPPNQSVVTISAVKSGCWFPARIAVSAGTPPSGLVLMGGPIPGNLDSCASVTLGATASGSSRLLLFTHGWASTADDWPSAMAENAVNTLTKAGKGQGWLVIAYDWSPFAGTTISGPGPAARNAARIGPCLATGLAEYSAVQAVAHSAGVWLIDGAIRGARTSRPGMLIQETFLDAYTPGFAGSVNRTTQGDFSPGVLLGEKADFAEHIFQREVPGTSDAFTAAVNLDITGFFAVSRLSGSLGLVAAHHQPVWWYLRTVVAPASYGGEGFARSLAMMLPASPHHTDIDCGLNAATPGNCARGALTVFNRLSVRPMAPVRAGTTAAVTVDSGAASRTCTMLLAAGDRIILLSPSHGRNWPVSTGSNQLEVTLPASTPSGVALLEVVCGEDEAKTPVSVS
jgi:Tol biopolymer transport system component